MMHSHVWAWATFFLLGAYHGINPAMGWLFAVALGLQAHSGRAVWLSLFPIATGHVLAFASVILGAAIAGEILPLQLMKIVVATLLLGFGLYRIFSNAHPRATGMQVGFRDLATWSFLMASAHGAGFMLLPVLLGISATASIHGAHGTGFPGMRFQVLAVAIHTFGYLLLTGTTAWVVYRWIGLSLLRKAWLNLDFVWAATLIVTAGGTLLIS